MRQDRVVNRSIAPLPHAFAAPAQAQTDVVSHDGGTRLGESGRKANEGTAGGSKPTDAPFPIPHQRARGSVSASFRQVDGASRIARLHQSGCLKLRFPRLPDRAAQSILINSSGGLTGGDRVDQAFAVATGAALTITTQACERVYRSCGGHAGVTTRLTIDAGASCAYLPQETILFDGGAVCRTLDVDAAADASVLLCESVILGRTAMGETVGSGLFRDRWRVRIGGRLAFADDLRLDGAIAEASRQPASLAGHRAFASILYAAPDAEMLRDIVRERLGETGGASLVGGVLIVRMLAPTGLSLRQRLIPALAALAKRPLPLVWSL